MNINRRRFIQGLGISLLTPYTLTNKSHAAPYANFTPLVTQFSGLSTDSQSVFDLSVASGDPTDSGVILWTHIKADAFDGISTLYFEVAEDSNFNNITLQGAVNASDFDHRRDHTVNIDLNGELESERTYYYRFVYANTVSRTGRCKTLPSKQSDVSKLKFAVLTCQDYTTGNFNAFYHLADEELDFVIHLGDFIYEYDRYSGFEEQCIRTMQLPSQQKMAVDLEDFRYLYRTYRSDPNLQRAMEQHTFIITWDDHETADNCYWDYEKQTMRAPYHPFKDNDERMKQLRSDAQKAWIEYVPARVEVNENADSPLDYLTLYRSFKAGNFLELFMTDSRTYRTKQPCRDESAWDNYWCTDYKNSSQTMLGEAQRNWLINGLVGSNAKWKFWGNQTLLAQLALTVLGQEVAFANYDAWDGYQNERDQIMRAVKENDVSNFVVLTGDMHTTLASYLKVNYGNINNWDYSNLVGLELMTPSVSSPNLSDSIANGAQINQDLGALLNSGAQVNNPHIKHFSGSVYGYSIVELKDNDLEWQVYHIDKLRPVEDTNKQLRQAFTYDPYWMWLKQK